MDPYTILLGIAAVISAMNGSRTTKSLEKAVNELRAELSDHRGRITALEAGTMEGRVLHAAELRARALVHEAANKAQAVVLQAAKDLDKTQ